MRVERVGKTENQTHIFILEFNPQQDYKLRALLTIGYPTNVQEPQLGIPHPKTTLKDTPPSIN